MNRPFQPPATTPLRGDNAGASVPLGAPATPSPKRSPASRDYATVKILQVVRLENGVLTWNERAAADFNDAAFAAPWNTRHANQPVALKLKPSGYVACRFHSCWFMVHRLVWALHYGEWPRGDIDHINGNRSDNRVENLRDVTRVENNRNAKMRADNTSGATGVRKYKKKWTAVICEGGRTRHLGCFESFEAAVAARQQAANERGYSPRHGKAA